ncbi:MAG TPA: CpcT/CpeT family chromophore lyase [Steroidobacteraceae bacterium]|nr:CpcT/CpeT family chromophore lyase [Steroidobacteraceae bacterium]
MVENARLAITCTLLAAVCCSAAPLLGGCTDQTKVYEGDLTSMLAVLPGRYDNTAQVEADARSGVHPGHDAVALTITHVYTPRLGHHVYYAQETAADNPLRVFSEKMYGFQVDEKRGIVETIYEFTEPLRWRDGQQNKELFTSVTIEDVQPEGCQLLWKSKDAGFVAHHDPKVCPDPGGTAAAPVAELSAGVLDVGDYKFRKARQR